ncbi:YCF48-related protein [Calditrichota bacterium]
MRKNIFYLLYLFSIFIYDTTFCQVEWEWLYPRPTGDELSDIFMVDSLNGWAVGQHSIVHTSNGGEDWTMQHNDLADYYHAVHFTDINKGWVVGSFKNFLNGWYYCKVLFTNDGGLNWQTQIIDTTVSFWDVFFINDSIGWILGGGLLKTIDGGENWIKQKSDSTFGGLSIYFVNSDTGWVVCGESIFNTIDGGENWVTQANPAEDNLESIYFIDTNIGWAVGCSNTILHTSDGGNNWFKQTPGPNLENRQLTSVYFTDENHGYIAGWGIFLTTENGGQNWTVFESPVPVPSALSVFFINPQVGWKVGNIGTIQKTIDGGDTWITQSKILSYNDIVTVDFVDENYGWVTGGSSEIYYTNDGGINWELKNRPSPHGIFSIDFIDSLVGFTHYGWKIYKTSDGGDDWIEVYTFNSDPIKSSIFFINEHKGWVIHSRDKILHTSDGGLSWSNQQSNTNKTLFDIEFVDDMHGWIVGELGLILRTSDGGENWENIEMSNAEFDLVKVDFTDSLNGWVVGNRNLFHTEDGGETWIMNNIEDNFYAHHIEFIDENTGWVQGFYEESYYTGYHVICQTNDNGNSWSKTMLPNVNANYNSIDFVSKTEGWLVGSSGIILHIMSDSVTTIKDVILQPNKKQFMLYQNYPNPFNPATVISYQLPVTSYVKLAIYNILGQQVQTLISQKQNAGSYEVRWDASSFASGVYFYKLETSNFVQTKKLILMQ